MFEIHSCHFETFSYHCAVACIPPLPYMETAAQALSSRIAELEGGELPVGLMRSLKESLKDPSGAVSAQTILTLNDADHLPEIKTAEGQKTNIEYDFQQLCVLFCQQGCPMRPICSTSDMRFPNVQLTLRDGFGKTLW